MSCIATRAAAWSTVHYPMDPPSNIWSWISFPQFNAASTLDNNEQHNAQKEAFVHPQSQGCGTMPFDVSMNQLDLHIHRMPSMFKATDRLWWCQTIVSKVCLERTHLQRLWHQLPVSRWIESQIQRSKSPRDAWRRRDGSPAPTRPWNQHITIALRPRHDYILHPSTKQHIRITKCITKQ